MAIYGKFVPKNPDKYVGDVDKIFFRSLWETKVMQWMDSRSSIIKWGSEEIAIPYLSPADGKVHRYFPDFFIEYVTEAGEVKREILEVKPLHESDAKYAKSDRSKNALQVNESKWRAASRYCEERGMTFRVLTEKSIFKQAEKKPRQSKKKLNG
jgi:hypothetical protein